VMVPGMFALGYVFGEPSLAMLQWVLSHAWMLLAGPVALAICGMAAKGADRPIAA